MASRKVFRVSQDAQGNVIVPRGTPVLLPDGTVVGVSTGTPPQPGYPALTWATSQAMETRIRTSAIRTTDNGWDRPTPSLRQLLAEAQERRRGLNPTQEPDEEENKPYVGPIDEPDAKSAIDRLLEDDDLV